MDNLAKVALAQKTVVGAAVAIVMAEEDINKSKARTKVLKEINKALKTEYTPGVFCAWVRGTRVPPNTVLSTVRRFVFKYLLDEKLYKKCKKFL
jgi:hypothetical protein